MYDVIYLIPDDEGAGHVWCQDPAPGIEMKEEDAIKYIRADLVDKRQAQQAVEADSACSCEYPYLTDIGGKTVCVNCLRSRR